MDALQPAARATTHEGNRWAVRLEVCAKSKIWIGIPGLARWEPSAERNGNDFRLSAVGRTSRILLSLDHSQFVADVGALLRCDPAEIGQP